MPPHRPPLSENAEAGERSPMMSVRFPKEVYVRMRHYMEKYDSSPSAMIRTAVVEYLEKRGE